MFTNCFLHKLLSILFDHVYLSKEHFSCPHHTICDQGLILLVQYSNFEIRSIVLIILQFLRLIFSLLYKFFIVPFFVELALIARGHQAMLLKETSEALPLCLLFIPSTLLLVVVQVLWQIHESPPDLVSHSYHVPVSLLDQTMEPTLAWMLGVFREDEAHITDQIGYLLMDSVGVHLVFQLSVQYRVQSFQTYQGFKIWREI